MSEINTNRLINKAAVLAGLIILFPAISSGYAADIKFKTYQNGICEFRLYDYELPNHFERAIVLGCSVLRDTYQNTFGFKFPKNFKVKLVIFGNKEKFLEYQQATIGTIISESGYYAGKLRETVVVINKKAKDMQKETKRMVGVTFHEASHMLLRYHIPWCPVWANEGLAEYFEGMNVFGENRNIRIQKNRMKWCIYWTRNGFPIDLQKYIMLKHDEWMAFRKQDSNAAYTIGYSLVYFLMSSKETEGVLKELLWEFKRQRKKTDSVQVIEKYYPGGIERMEKFWKKWIPKARAYRPLRALRKRTGNDPNNTTQNLTRKD